MLLRAWACVAVLALCAQDAAPERPAVLAKQIDLERAPEAFKRVNAELRKAGVVRAEFSEEKRIPRMKRALASSGEIVFSGARGLYRRTTAPSEQELIVTRKGIEQRTPSGVERFDLEKQPVARAFVDAFLLVFSGDERALAAQFELAFEGTFEQWSMGLVPRKEPLGKLIAYIVVSGKGAEIAEITVVETSGGRTLTKWTRVVLGKALTEDEERRFFGARE